MIDFIAEKRKSVNFWKDQICLLRNLGMREGALQKLALLVEPRNIGWSQGQIRPDFFGQWDVYFSLQGQVSEIERVTLSGLPAVAITNMERRLALEAIGVDSNNVEEVREFERIQNMGPEEIDRKLEDLECLLGNDYN